MTIGEVVQQYPSTVPVLLEAGVHCVGCHVAAWETLEEGFKGHGMDDEDIEFIMSKLNNIISEDNFEGEINVTPLAARKLKEILKEQGKDDYSLKIEIVPGGCNGMQYSFSLVKESDNGVELNFDGVKILLSKEDFELLKGSKVDYLENLTDAGFRIYNPNAKSSCGCGKSFS